VPTVPAPGSLSVATREIDSRGRCSQRLFQRLIVRNIRNAWIENPPRSPPDTGCVEDCSRASRREVLRNQVVRQGSEPARAPEPTLRSNAAGRTRPPSLSIKQRDAACHTRRAVCVRFATGLRHANYQQEQGKPRKRSSASGASSPSAKAALTWTWTTCSPCAAGVPQRPDEHRPERPVLLAIDQELGEGVTLLVAPELADPVGPLEVGELRTWSSSARAAGGTASRRACVSRSSSSGRISRMVRRNRDVRSR
jgi:hypothetical protein